MYLDINTVELTSLGLTTSAAAELLNKIITLSDQAETAEQIWEKLSVFILDSLYPFEIHEFIFGKLFPLWLDHPDTAPVWQPSASIQAAANITQFMARLEMGTVKQFHAFSVNQSDDFWQRIIAQLEIVFKKKPTAVCNSSKNLSSPHWLPDAKLNIAESCFLAPATATAILYEDKNRQLCRVSYQELNVLSNRIANSLIQKGLCAGDAIAIVMPMTMTAVAIYLGIIKMGGVVVSIADSFSSQEIASRFKSARAKAVFTQDVSVWNNKKIPLYEKVCTARNTYPGVAAFVLPDSEEAMLIVDQQDTAWENFLVSNSEFTAVACDPMAACNILFSSGTTAEPKAIAWNHTTPIKAASDAYFHQNIQANDVLAWPTNLGWMMGPWLVFAALINRATIALYPDAPKDRSFGEFVSRAQVTMLGVVPTSVAAWRQSKCMEGLDWQSIKVFSSTGECSNPENMFYLMYLAGYKPVIEYCGGTEIGGAYVSSTVVEKNYPSLFSTQAMGLQFVILDENGKQSEIGEVAIIPPSMGLSTTLLNADHYQVYFANMPTTDDNKILRRHGDQIRQLPNGYYSILGRVDDTMNLGGIKVSAAEIERTLAGMPDIVETSAIAISPVDNGPSQLIIYAVTQTELPKQDTLRAMQKRINTSLNPLFKIHDVVFTRELPKTASNKIMRRLLRKTYQENI